MDVTVGLSSYSVAPLSGAVVFGEKTYTIEGKNQNEEMDQQHLSATVGYYIWRDEQIVTAVEVVDKGRVWFHADLKSEE